MEQMIGIGAALFVIPVVLIAVRQRARARHERLMGVRKKTKIKV